MQNVNGLTQSMRTIGGTTRTEAKAQALSWLASQLRWENTLDALRDDADDEVRQAA
jgi:hypothetical protein